MLGTRTKQIKAYGKRGRTIVNAPTADDSLPVPSNNIISIFDSLPPAPEWKSLASKMKKRENAPLSKPLKPKLPLQRRRRVSPVLSPKTSLSRHVKTLIRDSQTSKPLPSMKADDGSSVPASVPRPPLSLVSQNIPGTPALSGRPRQHHRKSLLKSRKQITQVVDVDIIVLDDKGSTVSRERRVSRTHLPATNLNQVYPKPVMRPRMSLEETDSEYEQPKRPRQHITHKKAIVITDESESDDELLSARNEERRPPSDIIARQSVSRSSSVIEVLIPPAPYRIHYIDPLQRITAQSKTSPVKESPQLFDHNPVSEIPIAQTKKSSLQPKIPAAFTRPVASRHHFLSSPVLKTRQLTPIRRGPMRIFEPSSPPSPTTPTDLDLSVNFSELHLEDDNHDVIRRDFEMNDSLWSLLEECRQELCGPHNFSAFIESFPFDLVLQSADGKHKGKDMQFRKIGEASYSEVFGIGDVVLKVIPLNDVSKMYRACNADEKEGPPPTDAKDVRKEIIVTRAMGEVCDGFVKLLKTYVVRGRYPEVLLQLWDEYNKRKGSESIRPDTFKVSQLYAIIVLPNGGTDLESYVFQNASKVGWRQASSLFWQLAKSLAHAENLVSFEHRDLHWGQILVKNLSIQMEALKPLNLNQKSKAKSRRVWMDDPSFGIQATIIDLGLSRMDAGDGGHGERVHWTPFEDEIFMGQGDYQFEIYRIMRELIDEAWEGFHPMTNNLWLHYLLRKLLNYKGLKPPRKIKTTIENQFLLPSETSFTEKDCYDSLVDIEVWLGRSIEFNFQSHSKLKVKGKKNASIPKSECQMPACAGEIVAYGVKKGWIGPTNLS